MEKQIKDMGDNEENNKLGVKIYEEHEAWVEQAQKAVAQYWQQSPFVKKIK